MNLGDTGNEAKCIVPPEKHVGNKVDIFLRDFSCWYEAFIKNWWIIAGCAIFMAVLFVVYRSWKVPQIYSSSCLLVRQSVADMKHSDFPQNYNNTQMNVIINIAQEKSALQEMARRLDINADSDKLHKMIVVQPSTENSDYFYISAISRNPKLAAAMANTLAQVFLERYRGFKQEQVRGSLEASKNNLVKLNNELDVLQKKLSQLYTDNGLDSAEANEFWFTQRIAAIEERRQNEVAQIEAYRKMVNDLTWQLSKTPENIIVRSEQLVEAEKQLTEERLKLEMLLQKYTEANPIVQKQRELLKSVAKKVDLAKGEFSKLETEKNIEYTRIADELAQKKSLLTTSESQLKDLTESLSKLQFKLGTLNRIMPQVVRLNDQITQKQDQIDKANADYKDFEFALDGSFSEVKIHEPAPVPTIPISRKHLLFVFVWAIVGGLIGFFTVLGMEAFNLKIRSKADFINSLHISSLGVIPGFSTTERAEYYSALQELFECGQKYLVSRQVEKPYFVAIVRPDEYTGWEDDLWQTLLQFIAMKENDNYRIIRDVRGSVSERETLSLLNDYIYALEEKMPPPQKKVENYFMLNDFTLMSPPDAAQLARLRCGYAGANQVVWELFTPWEHWQYFNEVCSFADMVVIPCCYNKSSKLSIANILEHGEFDRKKVFGLLYNYKKKRIGS